MDFQLPRALEVLERTPAAFRALLDGMPDEWTRANEGPDSFSAFDNLGHLIHGERTDWIPRARIILAQGADRRFAPYDRFAQYRESEGKSVAELLDELARLRAENLATLRGWSLSPRELALEGEHPAFGRVTLAELLATWVAHDLGHLAQTARVLAKQYREAVGPWRAYLPVLDRGGPAAAPSPTARATAGIIGGLGPESTIDYYRRILEAWAQAEPGTMPSLVIDSLDVRQALHLVDVDRPALVEYLLASVRRLAGAGARFVAMTANTPHLVFDELAARSPVPMLSIVEVCADEAERRGLRRLALLGTRFTMEAPFYREVFARRGIVVASPDAADRAWVHERYIGQLLEGDFRDETRREFEALVDRLRDEKRVDGVILGGTELPLLLRAPEIAGLPALDTTALHVAAIVARLRGGEAPAA